MKISKITTKYIAKYLRIDEPDEQELTAYLVSAKQMIISLTGLKENEIDKYEDLSQACMVLISDMYENHLYHQGGVGVSIKVNGIVDTIINSHRINLI